jgi:hypothetical protein
LLPPIFVGPRLQQLTENTHFSFESMLQWRATN